MNARVFSTRIQPRDCNAIVLVALPDLFKVHPVKISMFSYLQFVCKIHYIFLFVGLQRTNAMKCFIVRMPMTMATSTTWNSPKPSNTAKKTTD